LPQIRLNVYMPRDIPDLIINLETLLKLPPQVRKGPFDLLSSSKGNYLSPRKFFAVDRRLPGLNSHIRGLRGFEIGKRHAGSPPQYPNAQGTSGGQRHWFGVDRDQGQPMEHFDVRKITKPRNRAQEPLTTRERQIVLVLSEGVTNREIGRRLKLAEGTVKVHLHHIYRKLGIANRTALAVLAHTKTLDAA
jgi:DNA-binding CsgD family transcriptional regulator